jgi:predicted Zn-dependent protease
MKRLLTVATIVACGLLTAVPARAQLPGKLKSAIGKADDAADKAKKLKALYDSLVFTDEEEHQLGQQVSDQLRARFGVVQDRAVHKYVTLVGTVLAQQSSRPTLAWKFIVLDTDGVNAYASPGGFIHITRGALSLLQNESELADVLGHEIAHVTQKHTINAIRQGKLVELGADMTRNQVLSAVANKSYEIVFEGQYDRGQELDADKTGVGIANKAGYAPGGLAAFLTRLDERNKDNPDRNGLFASHPATKERISELSKEISAKKLNATAIVAGRYKASITYKPVPLTQITAITPGASGLTGGSAKDTKPANTKSGGSKLGLGKLGALGGEKKASATVASAGARGATTDRDAKGGSNAAIVTIVVTALELVDFKKGISG